MQYVHNPVYPFDNLHVMLIFFLLEAVPEMASHKPA